MSVQRFAMIWGILFLLIGIGGFLFLEPHTHPDVTMEAGLGLELGLFPVNLLHNLVHIAFGLWGILAARNLSSARGYAKATAIIYSLFVIMGLIPAARLWTTFGLVPLYGHDIWLHVILAAGAAYFGFVKREGDVRR